MDYTPAENYIDNSGNMRTFNHVDHDVKTKISLTDISKAKDNLEVYKSFLIDRILGLPASMCPTLFHDYTIRGDVESILWNEEKIKGGNNHSVLRDISTLIENKQR